MKKKLQECVEGLLWALFQPFLVFQAVKNSDLFSPVRRRKEEGLRILLALRQTGTLWDGSRYLTWKLQLKPDCPFLTLDFVFPKQKELN